ncbi:MAG: threonylcarbamoyl-AMP synthase [Verrucomicrobia bacterium 21-51-4]|nr:MAG: threonylcarbamoyl-AMP synthase [Verrucomicrobia bacterium 21-51-4]HQU08511.1 L-threonylcarbamoyladenylate synthase [Opitutales bacterium]
MACTIYKPDPASLSYLASVLSTGGLVALPTETVYGLAGNALDKQALRSIFEVKGRPLIDPLIVHVLGVVEAQQLAHWGPMADRLAQAFWPGPLTLVLPKKPCVPDLATAGQPSVALRAPAHPLFREILALAQVPLAAPSANPFGYISPSCAEHVVTSLGNRLEHVLDGGPCDWGLESTIVSLLDPEKPVILRHGPIPPEAIAEALGCELHLKDTATASDKEAQIAPGMLSRHYSPHCHTYLVKNQENTPQGARPAARVCLARPLEIPDEAGVQYFWLSESGDLQEAARELYQLLRKLDQPPWKAIYLELAPETGIGHALNDRIRRAASCSP